MNSKSWRSFRAMTRNSTWIPKSVSKIEIRRFGTTSSRLLCKKKAPPPKDYMKCNQCNQCNQIIHTSSRRYEHVILCEGCSAQERDRRGRPPDMFCIALGGGGGCGIGGAGGVRVVIQRTVHTEPSGTMLQFGCDCPSISVCGSVCFDTQRRNNFQNFRGKLI